MAAQLDRDPVFGALTRPQMFAGVTYSYLRAQRAWSPPSCS